MIGYGFDHGPSQLHYNNAHLSKSLKFGATSFSCNLKQTNIFKILIKKYFMGYNLDESEVG